MKKKIKIKINKGKLKNLAKRKMIIANKGSATAETILIIAIMLVIVITVFYPQLESVIDNTFSAVSSWYNATLSDLGMI